MDRQLHSLLLSRERYLTDFINGGGARAIERTAKRISELQQELAREQERLQSITDGIRTAPDELVATKAQLAKMTTLEDNKKDIERLKLLAGRINELNAKG